MNWKMEKEGLCYIWLYSYFERVIVSDSVDVDSNPCSVCCANLEPGGHYQFCTGWNS